MHLLNIENEASMPHYTILNSFEDQEDFQNISPDTYYIYRISEKDKDFTALTKYVETPQFLLDEGKVIVEVVQVWSGQLDDPRNIDFCNSKRIISDADNLTEWCC
jgi:hypothetical protein